MGQCCFTSNENKNTEVNVNELFDSEINKNNSDFDYSINKPKIKNAYIDEEIGFNLNFKDDGDDLDTNGNYNDQQYNMSKELLQNYYKDLKHKVGSRHCLLLLIIQNFILFFQKFLIEINNKSLLRLEYKELKECNPDNISNNTDIHDKDDYNKILFNISNQYIYSKNSEFSKNMSQEMDLFKIKIDYLNNLINTSITRIINNIKSLASHKKTKNNNTSIKKAHSKFSINDFIYKYSKKITTQEENIIQLYLTDIIIDFSPIFHIFKEKNIVNLIAIINSDEYNCYLSNYLEILILENTILPIINKILYNFITYMTMSQQINNSIVFWGIKGNHSRLIIANSQLMPLRKLIIKQELETLEAKLEIIRDLISKLLELHSNGIVHGDINIDNIVFTYPLKELVLELSDKASYLGQSRSLMNSKLKEFATYLKQNNSEYSDKYSQDILDKVEIDIDYFCNINNSVNINMNENYDKINIENFDFFTSPETLLTKNNLNYLVAKYNDLGKENSVNQEDTLNKDNNLLQIYNYTGNSEYNYNYEVKNTINKENTKNKNKENYLYAKDIWSLGMIYSYLFSSYSPKKIKKESRLSKLLHNTLSSIQDNQKVINSHNHSNQNNIDTEDFDDHSKLTNFQLDYFSSISKTEVLEYYLNCKTPLMFFSNISSVYILTIVLNLLNIDPKNRSNIFEIAVNFNMLVDNLFNEDNEKSVSYSNNSYVSNINASFNKISNSDNNKAKSFNIIDKNSNIINNKGKIIDEMKIKGEFLTKERYFNFIKSFNLLINENILDYLN